MMDFRVAVVFTFVVLVSVMMGVCLWRLIMIIVCAVSMAVMFAVVRIMCRGVWFVARTLRSAAVR